MKDLFVLTADADAEAFISTVLSRHEALGVRPLAFEVRRFPGRDPGMVKEGPEIARRLVDKREYARLVLVWDHQGSGWHQREPADAVRLVEVRLHGVTWESRSAAVVVVPELEEWLWHCQPALARRLNMPLGEFETLVSRLAAKRYGSIVDARRRAPKELFKDVLWSRERRGPLLEDFEALGAAANLDHLSVSETFGRLRGILRHWFPPAAPTASTPVKP